MTVSSLIEIPENLYDAVSQFTETNDRWDYNQIVVSALEMFLIQNKICTATDINNSNRAGEV